MHVDEFLPLYLTEMKDNENVDDDGGMSEE